MGWGWLGLARVYTFTAVKHTKYTIPPKPHDKEKRESCSSRRRRIRRHPFVLLKLIRFPPHLIFIAFLSTAGIDGAEEEGYEPPKDFQEDAKEPLVDFQLTGSTELWLIQWPSNKAPDFDGKEVTLDLNRDGPLGTFEVSSGKEYNVVSFAAQEPDATVFLSSASEAKIVGKIARCVSFVHYPDPEELETQKPENVKPLNIKSGGTTYTGSQSRLVTPTRSTMQNSGSTHSSRHKSSASKTENSSSNKRRHVGESSGSKDWSIPDSGLGRSAYTSSGASLQSQER